MTMDVRRRVGTDSGGGVLCPQSSEQEQSKPAVKRSFDVAFLMAPDDQAKRRQQHQEEVREQQLRLVSAASGLLYPAHGGRFPQQQALKLAEMQAATALAEKDEEKKLSHYPELGLLVPADKEFAARSAFTKVAREGGATPPGPAVSPHEYQPDLSPNSRSPTYYTKFVPKPPYFGEKSSPESEKKRFPDVVPYGGLAMAYPFPAVLPPAPPALLTAANVTAALLPSSLAALTLPAQNVCAKCNISFRMTSDLVYHMRSQHKSDHAAADSNRRRREQDKLRCPVCNESFRERHHLTRHMTAHQDKDGDRVDDDEEVTLRRRLTK